MECIFLFIFIVVLMFVYPFGFYIFNFVQNKLLLKCFLLNCISWKEINSKVRKICISHLVRFVSNESILKYFFFYECVLLNKQILQVQLPIWFISDQMEEKWKIEFLY